MDRIRKIIERTILVMLNNSFSPADCYNAVRFMLMSMQYEDFITEIDFDLLTYYAYEFAFNRNSTRA